MDLPSYEEIFGKIKFNFWTIGIQFNNPKISFRFYILCVLLILMLTEENAYFVSKITSGDYNVLELVDLVPCFCIGTLSQLKLLFLVHKREKIFKLNDCLEKLYKEAISDLRKKKIIRKEVLLINNFLKYFFILNSVLISVYNFSPLFIMGFSYFINGKVIFILPYPVLVPFSTNAWPTWFIVYVHSITCGLICILFITISDGLFCIFTSHICNHFSVLSTEIKKLDETNVNLLGKLVRRHQYMLRLSSDLEDIFKLPNLFNYLVGSLEICALGFSITTGSWELFLGYILFLLSVLLQILMMSVFGENIITESRKVGEAAYLSQWHLMDEEMKKIILIIMIRSHKQQQLTAYNFSVISYGSFSKIISTSWSYFTILKTVYKP